MAASERLFIGLWPDGALQGDLAAWRDACSWPPSAIPVATPKLHLTLHFLGNVAVDAIDALTPALALPFTPFTLTLATPALWHGGIAVLEPLVAPAALLDLHHRLGDALDGAGIVRDTRPYRPHVTMARRAAGAVPPAPATQLTWPVDRFMLMASRAGVYAALRVYPAAP